jgi:PAS domain S-box-containing protein
MPVDAGPPPEIFRLAVEASPSGMIAVNDDGAVIMINGEIERLFGYGREELLGQPVDILLPDGARAKHAIQRSGYMLRPGARRMGIGREFLGRRKDGGQFPIEIGLNSIRIDGGVVVLCAIVDISERKHLQRLQDEFVITVSHELRTPMTSIAGSLGLLIGGVGGTLPVPAVRLIEIAYNNCRRLVRLLNDILDSKKLDSSPADFNFQRCAARVLVERTIESNRGLADGYGLRVRLDAATDTFDVRVDPDRFVQVITNLLSNAFKFSPSGQEVVVSIETRGDNIHIAVRDHGGGIPAAFKPRVFERFAQADTANGQQKSGTGLGLSIVRQIVAQMQGYVGFDDAPGGGTVFYVDLPRADRLAQSGAGGAIAPEPLRPNI